MKILVVGSGGREHAIIKKLHESKYAPELFCAPGNGGIASLATCFNIKATDVDGIVNIAKEKNIDLVFVAPDDPLMLGTVDKLEENGITGYVINVGGNVRTIGTKPDGKSWVAGIENPDTSSDQSFIKYLALEGESVVTSGSYQRFYTVEGKRYHHIIDADTLMPAEGFMSVSVVCKDSGLTDALSTALFCMDFEKGLLLVESLEGVEAMWVLDNGEQKISSGFERYVTEI